MKNFLIAAGRKIKTIFRPEKRRKARGSITSSENEKSPEDNARMKPSEKAAGEGSKLDANRDVSSSAGAAVEKKRKSQQKPESSWTLDEFSVTPEPGKSRFHDFQVPLSIMHAIADLDFKYCTAIQEKALEPVLSGKDLVGKANTGTGKTAVFLIAILSRLLAESDTKSGGKGKKGVKALILAPTRELVIQIAKDGAKLAKYCRVSINAVYGGEHYQKQMDALKYGHSDIVVATPGRLLDFVGKKIVNLNSCRILVLDEADRMLDMGFIPDVRRIVGRLPEAGKRQTMLFSATVPDDVQRLAYQWCIKPEVVEAETGQVALDAIDEVFYLATAEEKYTILLNLINSHPEERIIVFANMKNETRRLAERLQRDGIDCVLLSGDVAQNKRGKRLERFRAGQVKVLVATDVAGRGIHIEDITMVVNYTLPYEPEDYVHRIGRTGRAGACGKAVSFACEQGSFYLPAIEEFIDRKIECVLPDESLLAPPVIKKKKKSNNRKPSRPYRKRTKTNRPRRRPGGSSNDKKKDGPAPKS